MNSKIQNTLKSKKKISGLEYEYLGIFVFLYTLKLHMYYWIQDIEFILVRGLSLLALIFLLIASWVEGSNVIYHNNNNFIFKKLLACGGTTTHFRWHVQRFPTVKNRLSSSQSIPCYLFIHYRWRVFFKYGWCITDDFLFFFFISLSYPSKYYMVLIVIVISYSNLFVLIAIFFCHFFLKFCLFLI